MPDGFDDLFTRANGFFTDLCADNTRTVYEANKGAYTSDIKKPAKLLADLMAKDLSKRTCKAHKP